MPRLRTWGLGFDRFVDAVEEQFGRKGLESAEASAL